MPGPTPLPDELRGRPVHTTDVRAHGLSPKILRGQRFRRRSRDLYVPADWNPSLADECAALVPLLPDSHAFSDATAAMLPGLPVPLRMVGQLHVVTPPGQEPPRRAGLIGHQRVLPPSHLTVVRGLKVTRPARTLADVAPRMRLHELVAAGDFALRELGMERAELEEVVAWATGRRGVARLRDAMGLFHPGAESPQESILRVWLVLAGLPVLEPNGEVWGGDGLVARVDLLSRRYRIAVEYEGAYHRSREQYAADIRRRAGLAAEGYEVVQVEATMMGSAVAVVQHVGSSFRRRGWLGSPTTTRLIR